jgi:hypothetical protein
LDTNEPFYVGIGRKGTNFTTLIKEYPRAYTKNNRSEFWFNITKKTDYSVEIIYETTSFIEIQEKEIEFIKLYGRKDLNEGSLVNLTDGGITFKNVSNLSKTKMSASQKGKKLSKESITKRTNSRKGKYLGDNNVLSKEVYVYDIEGNFIKRIESIHLASILLNCSYSSIHRILNNKAHSVNGYRFSHKFEKKLKPIIKKKLVKAIRCYSIDNGEKKIFMVFSSISNAAKYFNGDGSFISKVCRTYKKAYGYFWEYI